MPSLSTIGTEEIRLVARREMTSNTEVSSVAVAMSEYVPRPSDLIGVIRCLDSLH